MKPDADMDEKLIQKFLDGDPVAFEVLILRHQQSVFNLCLKMLGQKEEAEDLSQEVLVSLIGKLKGFRGESSFRTWLYRMTRNKCLDRLRRKVPEAMEPQAVETAAVMWQPEGGGPEAAAINNCSREELTAAFQKIPVEFRSAVILKDVEDLSHEDIAAIEDVPIGTVKSRISRGRRLLADVLMADWERNDVSLVKSSRDDKGNA